MANDDSEKVGNRKFRTYFEPIEKHLKTHRSATWDEIVQILMKQFSWTPKTASNRIHELIAHGLLKVEGKYLKGTFGRIAPDSRVLSLNRKK